MDFARLNVITRAVRRGGEELISHRAKQAKETSAGRVDSNALECFRSKQSWPILTPVWLTIPLETGFFFNFCPLFTEEYASGFAFQMTVPVSDPVRFVGYPETLESRRTLSACRLCPQTLEKAQAQ